MVLILIRSIDCGTSELGEAIAILIGNENPFAPLAGGRLCTKGIPKRDPVRPTLAAIASR